MTPLSTFQSAVVVCRSSPPASSAASLWWTRDTWPVCDDLRDTGWWFSRFDVTNYEYIQGTINLFNCPGKVVQSSATKNTTDIGWPVVSCVQWGAGERSRGVIMIDISAGDTSAIWHVRWQGITRKIRLGRAGQQIRKIYSAHLKKHSANTWLEIELVTKLSAYSGASELCSDVTTMLRVSGPGCLWWPAPVSRMIYRSLTCCHSSHSMQGLGQSHRQSSRFFM